MKHFFYPEIDSTNHQARLLLADGQCDLPFWVSAGFQTRGRGHGANRWESRPGQNLTATRVHGWQQLDPARQFAVSQSVSLALLDFLNLFVDTPKIKWPNDIYLNDQKIAGILIENDIAGASISLSVIGIGVNINQTDFQDDIPNPVSLSQMTGFDYDLNELLSLLDEMVSRRLQHLPEIDFEALNREYLRNLYRFKTFCPYRAGEEWFEARITGLGEFGELQLEDKSGKVRSFGFKEVEFIL